MKNRKEYDNWKKELNNKYGKNPNGIVKEYTITNLDEGNISLVREEDYLKIVEEKEVYKNKFEKLMSDDRYLKKIEELEKELYIIKETHVEYVEKKTDDRIKFEKEIKEKDEEIEGLNQKLESLKECKENPLAKFRAIEEWREENEKLKEENRRLKENNEVLTELLRDGEDKEKLWMLEYIYSTDKVNCKIVTLDPQPKEELEEIIGMDSDNWIQYKMWEVN